MASEQDLSGLELNMEIIALAKMIPQRKDLVVFVGRNRGVLVDNVKYAYLEAARGNYAFEPLFVTTVPEEAGELAGDVAAGGYRLRSFTRTGGFGPINFIQGFSTCGGRRRGRGSLAHRQTIVGQVQVGSGGR